MQQAERLVEYALLFFLVFVVVVAILLILGEQVKEVYYNMAKKPVLCGYCDGNKWVYASTHDRYKEKCPVCKGVGFFLEEDKRK
jgi:phage FluMu protein Com